MAIARVVHREAGLSSPRRVAALEDLKVLSHDRDQLVRSRTQVANRAHRDLAVCCPGYGRRVPDLRSKRNLAGARALLRGDHSVRADLARGRLQELRRLDGELARTKATIESTLAESGTTLTSITGIGPLIAAMILGEVGDVRRIRSKAAFAQMAGTAPLPASSGQTTRHRLNRGGNRRLNFALHYLALVRYRTDEETRAYVQRRRAEGKSFKEAMRCLKRHLSNVVPADWSQIFKASRCPLDKHRRSTLLYCISREAPCVAPIPILRSDD